MSQLLNLEELNERHEVSDHNRIKLFSNILNSCHNKIRKYNKEFKKQECLYAPPTFILGNPPYNYVDLVNYIMDSLKNNGLKAEWLPNKKSIYISWRPIDVNLDQYRSHFSDTIYSDEPEETLKVMSVRQTPASKPSKKKTDQKPHVQHVAMISYNKNTKDMIPVNIKGFQTVNGGLRP